MGEESCKKNVEDHRRKGRDGLKLKLILIEKSTTTYFIFQSKPVKAIPRF